MISRTLTAAVSIAAAAVVDADSEALHLLQTQARPKLASEYDVLYKEDGDPPEPKVTFSGQGHGPRGVAPDGALKSDYDVLEESPQAVENLQFHNVAYRNLGGLGPHQNVPPNVRYKNVAKNSDGTVIDMILESDNFKTARPGKVGLFGKSAVVNIQNGNEVDFTARFVDRNDNPVTMGPFHVSFMDIDTGKEAGQEELTIGGFTSSYTLDETELSEVQMADGRTKFIAGAPGVGSDNPYDPLMLTDVQAKRTVSFTFPGGLSQFNFAYKVAKVAYEDYDAESEGRHFFMTGMSSLYFCEAKPVVVDYNMASVKYSNLGGLGPDFDSPQGLYFHDVATIENGEMLDLKIVNLTEYNPANTANNGLNGQFAQVNINGGSTTKFRFSFHRKDTGELYTMPWNLFTIYDLDHGKRGTQYRETLEVKDFATHYLTESSELHLHKHGDTWYTYGSTTWGTGKDNPTDPMNMTQQQKDRSVTLLFQNQQYIDATFAAKKPKRAGRNFLFSGKSALVFC